MKPTTIDLPLRTISLSYNSDAPLSPFELEAVEKYTALHHETQLFKQSIARLLNYYSSALGIQQQCRKQLNDLINEYVLISPLVQYYQDGCFLKESEVPFVPEEERVGYNIRSFFKQLQIFKHSYRDYIEPLKVAEKEYADMTSLEEKLEKNFDEFDEKYFSPIIHDYNNMEIDTASFDEDFDNFRGSFSELYTLNDKLCEARNAFVEAHTPINDQVAALDKDLTILFDVLRKLDDTNQEEN